LVATPPLPRAATPAEPPVGSQSGPQPVSLAAPLLATQATLPVAADAPPGTYPVEGKNLTPDQIRDLIAQRWTAQLKALGRPAGENGVYGALSFDEASSALGPELTRIATALGYFGNPAAADLLRKAGGTQALAYNGYDQLDFSHYTGVLGVSDDTGLHYVVYVNGAKVADTPGTPTTDTAALMRAYGIDPNDPDRTALDYLFGRTTAGGTGGSAG
jgi:hypothetical protein